MRRLFVAACAASLLTLAACTAETTQPSDSPRDVPAAESVEADTTPATNAEPIADANLETIRIDVAGMG